MIAQTIADYMGVTTGEMRELASEGAVTAEVVKNAMFAAAKETNAAFAQMPMTWGQVWTMAGNIATRALQPVLTGINWLANNIEIIGPLVLGVGSAFGIFLLAANWTKICTTATTALTTAQKMLSVVMATSWGPPLIVIALVVGAFYALIAIINKVAGTSVSATGIIAGAFLTLGAHILNQFVIPIQRNLATLANFIGNLFNDPVAAVQVLFLDMALTVLGYIRNVAQGIEDLINKIPGLNVNITSGIDSLYNKVAQTQQNVKDASGWVEYVKAWDYIDYKDAFSTGYNWGANLFSGTETGIPGLTDVAPYASQLDSIASDVGSIKKSVNMSDEDIKSLVDIAERRYVSNVNLLTQAPVINVQGQNTGDSAADRKALGDAIRDILIEQASAGTVRSTARAYSG